MSSVAQYYNKRSPPRRVVIGHRTIFVDSKLEERVIRYLDTHGYDNHWERNEHGISVWRYNYTPDLTLSVQFEGMSVRALIEIKPSVAHFTPEISTRMRKVAKFYYSQLCLLYSDREKCWYRVNIKTGKLEHMQLPPAGHIPIDKLYSPKKLEGRRIYNHRYIKRFNPFLLASILVENILEILLVGIKPKRSPSKRFNRRR
jgi:hypothetical protein